MRPIDPNDSGQFKPNDTLVMKLQRSRGGRESVGTGSGLGSAVVVLWLADQIGLQMDPVTAGVIGGFITSGISALIRKKLVSP
jgi:hypothetical protein